MGNEAHLFDIYNGSDYLIPAKRHTISPVNRKGLFFDIVQIFRIYRVLRKIVKTEKYDCIHLHWLFHQAPYAATFLKNVSIVALTNTKLSSKLTLRTQYSNHKV